MTEAKASKAAAQANRRLMDHQMMRAAKFEVANEGLQEWEFEEEEDWISDDEDEEEGQADHVGEGAVGEEEARFLVSEGD